MSAELAELRRLAIHIDSSRLSVFADRMEQLEADLKGSIEARKQLGRIVKERDEWIRRLEAKLERVRGLPSGWESEAQTRATTDESYSINGAYQFCAHQLRAALTEEHP